MKVSVAMATYNGEKYLKPQIDSILSQLSSEDELVISDDHSSDRTLSMIEEYRKADSRVKLYMNDESGVTSNFENAIKHTKNDIIFLSDQDDVWKPEKVETVKSYYEKNPGIQMIMSDITVVDNDLNPTIDSFYAYIGSRPGVIKNVIKNTYIGCAMSFRKELKAKILPIPRNVPMHDMWIGLVADLNKTAMMIPEKLIYYRRHEANVSSVGKKNTSSTLQKIIWRFQISSLLLQSYLKHR